MNQPQEPLALEEYRALRATIQARGSLRLLVTSITFIAWATLFLLGWPAISAFPPSSIVPLIVLASGFEVVFAAHVAAERIGRYLASRYEPDRALPGWEHAVLGFNTPETLAPLDPLNVKLFLAATVVNAAPMLVAGPPAGREVLLALGLTAFGAHALLVIRLFRAFRFARHQREWDTRLLSGGDATP